MNPKYSIVQTPKFERNLRKLRSELQRRISEQMLALEDQPLCGNPLHRQLKGLFSLTVGE